MKDLPDSTRNVSLETEKLLGSLMTIIYIRASIFICHYRIMSNYMYLQ